ncbi:hypothetical protein AHAS_Ahas05G0220800 [Arachis hypogaea]
MKKLNTTSKLVKIGMIRASYVNCILCRNEIESVHHLFFLCVVTWKLWEKVLEH